MTSGVTATPSAVVNGRENARLTNGETKVPGRAGQLIVNVGSVALNSENPDAAASVTSTPAAGVTSTRPACATLATWNAAVSWSRPRDETETPTPAAREVSSGRARR